MSETLTVEEIVGDLAARFPGLAPKASWGETSLFYNPGRLLPNGVYFCTVKERDGANDRASRLDRPGVFRVTLGLPNDRYEELFGPRPARPPKGGVVATGHDFADTDVLMPHPIYAWMGYVQILSPSATSFRDLEPLVVEAHRHAAARFDKLLATRPRSPQ